MVVGVGGVGESVATAPPPGVVEGERVEKGGVGVGEPVGAKIRVGEAFSREGVGGVEEEREIFGVMEGEGVVEGVDRP